jgi:hypothetical protein
MDTLEDELLRYDRLTARQCGALVDRFLNARDPQALRAAGYVAGLGLGAGSWTEMNLAADPAGAEAFVGLLASHPTFADASSAAPLMVLSRPNGSDVGAFDEIRVAGEFLVAGRSRWPSPGATGVWTGSSELRSGRMGWPGLSATA